MSIYSGPAAVRSSFKPATELFKIGDRVDVGADYSRTSGIVVGLSDEIPFKAQVLLGGKNECRGSTCWINTAHLWPSYYSEKPVKDKFSLDDRVQIKGVGTDCSEKFGTVVGFSSRFPKRAQVRLDPKEKDALYWIKTKDLSRV